MSNVSNTMTATCLAAASAGPLLADPNIPPPATVTINVEVEEIAVFELLSKPELLIVIDPERAQLGSTDTAAPPPAAMAQLRMLSNFCPETVLFEFDTVDDIRGDAGRLYGAAVAEPETDDSVLGVLPFFRTAQGSNLFGFPVELLDGAPTGAGGAAGETLSRSGSSIAGPNCNGVTDIYLGAFTRWDLTREGEPEFAAPGLYVLPMTATISGSS